MHLASGNDLKTFLLHRTAFLCVSRFLWLASFGTVNALMIAISVIFQPLFSVIPKIYSKFGRLKRGKIYYCPDKEIPISPKLHTPPYPHCIAHENLVASCQGKVFEGGEKYILHKCCNNFRGNDKIVPLFFIPRAAEIVRYEIDGTLTYFEKYESTISSLNLMHSTLIFMRKIWAKIVINNISLNQVNKALTDNDIRINIIDDIDIDISERKNLRIDLYWKLLIEYHWFYNYFQRMIA